MAVQPQAQVYTPDDLWKLAHSGDDKHYELVEGAIIEMPPPGDRHGLVVVWLSSLIVMHAAEHDLGDVTTETGYTLKPDTVVAPDVGFLSKARCTPLTGQYYPIAPDLAVEVVSPWDRPGQVRLKVALYLETGTQMVWVIYPEERFVDVYRADGTVSTYRGDETFDGGDVLPGFSMKASNLFKRLRE
jgi:Uma2 family endonuclease